MAGADGADGVDVRKWVDFGLKIVHNFFAR